MTPSFGPIAASRSGRPSRVIQGYFPGGRPAILQATRAAVQPRAGGAFALPAGFRLRTSGSGQSLPVLVQKKMESFFNTSFADVRIHVGHEAPSIGALAFTHGTDLYFAPGQYNSQSTYGHQLLGHELTHVVQQRAGRVRNPLGTGVAVVQDPALEAEAERMGRLAASAAMPIQAKPAGTGPVVGFPRSVGVRPVLQPKGGARWSAAKKAARKRQMDEDHELTWRQRSQLTQIVEADEEFFRQYLQETKPRLRVYRGNGIGVNANSLDTLTFTDILPGGRPDISFYGVVEHTHTNTLKNGMVSTTSSFSIAHGFATDDHKYGIVYEIVLDNYINVTSLQNRRNFRERYPGQYEILVPGPIPASKIVSATLYNKSTVVGVKNNR